MGRGIAGPEPLPRISWLSGSIGAGNGTAKERGTQDPEPQLVTGSHGLLSGRPPYSAACWVLEAPGAGERAAAGA